jgi:hypothetical protein
MRSFMIPLLTTTLLGFVLVANTVSAENSYVFCYTDDSSDHHVYFSPIFEGNVVASRLYWQKDFPIWVNQKYSTDVQYSQCFFYKTRDEAVDNKRTVEATEGRCPVCKVVETKWVPDDAN